MWQYNYRIPIRQSDPFRVPLTSISDSDGRTDAVTCLATAVSVFWREQDDGKDSRVAPHPRTPKLFPKTGSEFRRFGSGHLRDHSTMYAPSSATPSARVVGEHAGEERSARGTERGNQGRSFLSMVAIEGGTPASA